MLLVESTRSFNRSAAGDRRLAAIELAAHRLLGDVDAELLEDPLAKIDNAGLWPVFRAFHSRTQRTRVKIVPKPNRSRRGEPPSFAMSNQISADSGIPP